MAKKPKQLKRRITAASPMEAERLAVEACNAFYDRPYRWSVAMSPGEDGVVCQLTAEAIE